MYNDSRANWSLRMFKLSRISFKEFADQVWLMVLDVLIDK